MSCGQLIQMHTISTECCDFTSHVFAVLPVLSEKTEIHKCDNYNGDANKTCYYDYDLVVCLS